MAEVHISLAELDKIRDDLKKANETIAAKDLVIKEKDAEISKVLADKRTVLRTEKEVFKTKDPFEFDSFSFNRSGRIHGFSNLAQHIFIEIRPMFRVETRNNNEVIRIIDKIISRNLNSSYSKKDVETVVTTEYINFDDVVSELKEKAEKSVASEMDSLKKTLHTLQDSVTNNQINQSNAENRLIKKYEDEIKALNEVHYESYNKLLKDFENFKLDKDTRTLEQKVKDLEEELNRWKNKKWYQSKRSVSGS